VKSLKKLAIDIATFHNPRGWLLVVSAVYAVLALAGLILHWEAWIVLMFFVGYAVLLIIPSFVMEHRIEKRQREQGKGKDRRKEEQRKADQRKDIRRNTEQGR
jgi:membrane protein implicated in regulation of membrane protease activity